MSETSIPHGYPRITDEEVEEYKAEGLAGWWAATIAGLRDSILPHNTTPSEQPTGQNISHLENEMTSSK